MVRKVTAQDLGRVKGIEGHWVVVHKKKIVLSNDDVRIALREAEKYPDGEVFITKILHPGASYY